jgi:outer membrane protein assembly factor BamA
MRSAWLLVALLAPALLTAQDRPRPVEISGIPALNFDADEGFGYGIIVALYGYDTSATYRWTLQPTVFLTTQGRRDYTVFFDAPSRAGRAWRYTAFAGREQQLATPYYGIGNETPYNSAAEQGGTRYFYRYGRDRIRASADVQHALFEPKIRLLLGGGASSDRIDLTPFDSGTTLIQQELLGRTPAVGHTNYARVGLTYDTRDREIGTLHGTWADVIVQRVDKSLGASSSYTCMTATARRYEPLGDRFTVATRVLVQDIVGDAPFYALSEIQTTQKSQDGLGGSSSVRGLPKDRYVGKGIALANGELRWRALDFTGRQRHSSLVLNAFVDAGRVWTGGVDFSTLATQLHAGYGAGARLAFGQSFVIATDVAHSSQSTAPIYIGLGYMF